MALPVHVYTAVPTPEGLLEGTGDVWLLGGEPVAPLRAERLLAANTYTLAYEVGDFTLTAPVETPHTDHRNGRQVIPPRRERSAR